MAASSPAAAARSNQRHPPTALLLVRQAKGRTRIVYDLTVRPVGDRAPDQPPRGPDRHWERSTSGTAKGPGETLKQRA